MASRRIQQKPKSKFSFVKPPPTESATAPRPPQELGAVSGSVPTDVGPSVVRRIANRSAERITFYDVQPDSGETDGWTVSLEDLTECIVDLSAPTGSSPRMGALSSLHGRNLRRCVVLAGNVEGSVMLHDLRDCLLIATAQQVSKIPFDHLSYSREIGMGRREAARMVIDSIDQHGADW